MDAVSFVLGVKSSQLRSSQLKDLVYRGRKLAAGHVEEEFDGEFDEEDKEMDKKAKAKRAWVLAVFEDLNKKQWLFKRT
jgi:structural maintenance of chromosome 1